MGPLVAGYVRKFFKTATNKKLIKRLLQLGLSWDNHMSESGEALSLAGKIFVITGTISSYSRQELKEQLEARGAKVSSSVSKKTTALIVGADAGSKLRKAESLGVPVIGEEQLDSLLNGE